MLTDTALRNLRPKDKAYKVADRDGMYVHVATSGAVTFRYDYRLHGRRETLTIGKYGASRHTAYQLRPGTTIDPYQVSYHLAATNFVTRSVTGAAGPGPDDALKATMSHFIAAEQTAD